MDTLKKIIHLEHFFVGAGNQTTNVSNWKNCPRKRLLTAGFNSRMTLIRENTEGPLRPRAVFHALLYPPHCLAKGQACSKLLINVYIINLCNI